MNSDDIKRLRALCEQATQPGPWTVNVNDIGKDGDGHCVVLDAHGMWVADCGNAPADAAFIAAARTALPALLDRVQAAEGEVELHRLADETNASWRTQAAQRETAALNEVRRLTARLRECEAERDAAREECSRLMLARSPLDPSSYSLADAEFILMDHLKGMTIEDRSESLKRIGETESHALRSALLSAERDWRDATAERDRLRALLREAVEIARTHATHNNDDKDVRRLAAIKREGGLP